MMDTELEELLDRTVFEQTRVVLIPPESPPFLVCRRGHLVWDEGWWLACDLGKFQLAPAIVWYGNDSVDTQKYTRCNVLTLYHGHLATVENWDTDKLTPEQLQRPTEIDRKHGRFLAETVRGCSGVAIMDSKASFEGSLATGSIAISAAN